MEFGKEEVKAWFEITKKQNGLACSDSNSYQKLGLVVDLGSLSSLSAPARYRKMIGLMKFTKKYSRKLIRKEQMQTPGVPITTMYCDDACE